MPSVQRARRPTSSAVILSPQFGRRICIGFSKPARKCRSFVPAKGAGPQDDGVAGRWMETAGPGVTSALAVPAPRHLARAGCPQLEFLHFRRPQRRKEHANRAQNFPPSPPWGRGWRAAGVCSCRGATGEGVLRREVRTNRDPCSLPRDIRGTARDVDRIVVPFATYGHWRHQQTSDLIRQSSTMGRTSTPDLGPLTPTTSKAWGPLLGAADEGAAPILSPKGARAEVLFGGQQNVEAPGEGRMPSVPRARRPRYLPVAHFVIDKA